MGEQKQQTRAESVVAAYESRAGNLEAAAKAADEEREKGEKGFKHTDTPLAEEARFVANPADLRKEVSSEDEFSEGLEDGEDPSEESAKPAKKAAAKK